MLLMKFRSVNNAELTKLTKQNSPLHTQTQLYRLYPQLQTNVSLTCDIAINVDKEDSSVRTDSVTLTKA